MAPSETAYSTSPSHEPAAKKLKTDTSSKQNNGSEIREVTSAQVMDLERIYSAHNYHPLPVVFARGLGAKIWDPEGKEYLDFLAACELPPSNEN